MLEDLSHLDIVGTRIHTHAYGLNDSLPKYSNEYEKDRPLLSYAGHGGRDILSAGARAGMFALKQAFKEDISVLSLTTVVDEFVSFQRTLDFEDVAACLHCFKFDIKDFFTSIPHPLLMQAWNFFFTHLTEFSRRYSHILIPTKQESRTPRNIIWLRFARFAQRKPYTLSSRRQHKYTAQPRFSTNNRTPHKNYISISFSAIGDALRIDISSAISFLGEQPIRQKYGSPQGSPMSVFNASIVALFLEYRAWTDLRASCLDLIHQPYVRIFRARWVDDLFLLFATRYPLSSIHCAGIQMRFTDAYSPFGLKVEDASTFVGLNIDCQGRKLHFGIASKKIAPKYAHARSNITRSQMRGLIKTVVTRAIDCSTDPHTILRSIREIWHDFETVGYQIPIFRSVLDELRRKYPYLNDVLPTVL